MRKREIKYVGAWVNVHNERESKLVSIINQRLDSYVRYWLTEEIFREGFELERTRRAFFEELGGMGSTMFFLEMYHTTITSVDFFRAVEEQVNKIRELQAPLCWHCAYEGDCPNTVDGIEPTNCGMFVDQIEAWVD